MIFEQEFYEASLVTSSKYSNQQSLKKVAILQSNYIPWKGYFDIIRAVDEFIIYDEAQYTKNDWRNRNKIKTPSGVQWITIPVYQKTLDQRISETKVSNSKWAIKHWNTIQGNYAKAPYFAMYKDIFKEFYSLVETPYLSEINIHLLKLICGLLNIETRISNSSSFQLAGNPTERLVSLCKQTSSSIYLSGPAAKQYLEEECFVQEKISIEWMDYSDYPEYPQLFPPFAQDVSIIDLLFNVGPASTSFMKGKK